MKISGTNERSQFKKSPNGLDVNLLHHAMRRIHGLGEKSSLFLLSGSFSGYP